MRVSDPVERSRVSVGLSEISIDGLKVDDGFEGAAVPVIPVRMSPDSHATPILEILSPAQSH